MRTIALGALLIVSACQSLPPATEGLPRGSPALPLGYIASGTIAMHQRPVLLPQGPWTVLRDERQQVDGVVSISLAGKVRDRLTALDFKSTPAIVFVMDPPRPGVSQSTGHRVAVGFKSVCPQLGPTVLVSESLPSGIQPGSNDCLVVATKVVGPEGDAMRTDLGKLGVALSPLLIGVSFGASEPSFNLEIRASFDPALAGIYDATPSGWLPAAVEADPNKRSFIARAAAWARSWRVAIIEARAGKHVSAVASYP